MPSQRESRVQGLSGSRRVLIVDDQQDAAELVAMVLGEHGHEVKVAHDGETALSLAIQFRPQVALLDIGLPVMDGLRLAALMRARPELADCRLIAVSGYCSEYDRARSLSAGFEKHLAKPLAIDALLLAISSCESTEAPSGALGVNQLARAFGPRDCDSLAEPAPEALGALPSARGRR